MTEQDIIKVACDVCHLDSVDVMNRTSRTVEHVAARIIISSKLREEGYPMAVIKRMMNYKSNSAVLHVLGIADNPERQCPYTKSRIKVANETYNKINK